MDNIDSITSAFPADNMDELMAAHSENPTGNYARVE